MGQGEDKKRLSSRPLSTSRVLFLAEYAPLAEDEEVPALHPQDGVFPRYHLEVFRVLQTIVQTVIPTRNIAALFDLHSGYDYIFSLINRAPFNDSEVLVSSIAEYLGKPYLGARPVTRALAQDKHLTKRLAQALGLPTPRWVLVRERDHHKHHTPPFKGPYLTKPRSLAASFGIGAESVSDSWEETLKHSRDLAENFGDVIIEEFIPGTNVTLPTLGFPPHETLLPPIETVSNLPGSVESYEQKRLLSGGSFRRVYEGPGYEEIKNVTLTLLHDISPIDYTRFDYRVDANGKPWLLEFNVCCNLGTHSAVAMAARAKGIQQRQLIEQILDISLLRQDLKREAL